MYNCRCILNYELKLIISLFEDTEITFQMAKEGKIYKYTPINM